MVCIPIVTFDDDAFDAALQLNRLTLVSIRW